MSLVIQLVCDLDPNFILDHQERQFSGRLKLNNYELQIS